MDPTPLDELLGTLTDPGESEIELLGDARGVVVGPDVTSDTRQVSPGAVFVAIKGERVDGHDFASQAAQAGAAAIIATRPTDADLPHLIVDDPLVGLSRLARSVVRTARDGQLTVLAITGSSGKTSTKDLLAAICEAAGPTVAPPGSFNNELGAPLTACRVDAATQFLVSEMGSRGPGHLRWLTSIIAPDVSCVLNIGTAHLGEFGSIEATQRAKAELVQALDADGWAVLNADDPRVAAMADDTRGHVAWFSASGADVDGAELMVRALDPVPDEFSRFAFTLHVRQRSTTTHHPVQLRVVGVHQVANAVAAAASAIAAGVDASVAAEALSRAEARSAWRMELSERADGVVVINDAYNANPDSMSAALGTLGELVEARRQRSPEARGIAILGDMLELGDRADDLHYRVGADAARVADEVIAVGDWAPQLVAGATGSCVHARVATTDDALTGLVLAPADVVLVKASRGVGLEVLAERLLRDDEREDERW